MENNDQNSLSDGIQKSQTTLTILNGNLQNEPEKATERQRNLEKRLNKVADLNNNLLSRLTMSKSDKQLLKIDNRLTQEALTIIRNGENENLASIAQYQTRYLQTLLHNLVLVGESNIMSAAKIHYENAKSVLQNKLLLQLEDLTLRLEEYEQKASNRPPKFKKVMLAASNKILTQWEADFDRHLHEFSDLLNRTFKT